uniref:DM2 domain-containing protein n=1 Tax=viral metagenome TaxID=1070528 RepID=A0A6C0HFY2_9ZZZZ
MAESDAKEEENTLTTQFDGIVTTLSAFRTQITALQHQLRVLERSVTKEVKTLRKDALKKKAKVARKPSGFAKPSHITNELCLFMKLPENTEVARTEVTQYVIKYIRDHNLQHTDNRKIIMPDEALKQLLDIKEGDEVTYFNIQKYMNKHFQNNL